MNTQWYDEIFNELKLHHPYVVDDIIDVRPRGDRGLRLTLNDKTQYDYDCATKGLRRVVDFSETRGNHITDEWCRDSFAYHLIDQMNLKGHTQDTLAERSGLGKGSISKYINKKATPSMTALRKIANALDCSIAELLD